jgi:hypothetical protein
MSTTTNLPTIAARLRKLADAIDVADSGLTIGVYLSIRPDYLANETASMATVDQVAALIGLTAAPAKSSSGTWQHIASDDRDGVDLRVCTFIKAPAQRCAACGAVCTHREG